MRCSRKRWQFSGLANNLTASSSVWDASSRWIMPSGYYRAVCSRGQAGYPASTAIEQEVGCEVCESFRVIASQLEEQVDGFAYERDEHLYLRHCEPERRLASPGRGRKGQIWAVVRDFSQHLEETEVVGNVPYFHGEPKRIKTLASVCCLPMWQRPIDTVPCFLAVPSSSLSSNEHVGIGCRDAVKQRVVDRAHCPSDMRCQRPARANRLCCLPGCRQKIKRIYRRHLLA